MRIVSITKGTFSCGSGTTRESTSFWPWIAFPSNGPFPSWNSRGTPMASTGTRMSEKRIAASTPSRSTGWIVTWAASSGVLHMVRKEWLPRTFWYSGRYRPAWRMIHTGVTSTGSRRHAFRNRYSDILTSAWGGGGLAGGQPSPGIGGDELLYPDLGNGFNHSAPRTFRM